MVMCHYLTENGDVLVLTAPIPDGKHAGRLEVGPLISASKNQLPTTTMHSLPN